MNRLGSVIGHMMGLILVLGCGMATPVLEDTELLQTRTGASSGIAPKFTPGELYEISDSVAVGRPTSHRTMQKSVVASPTYPEDLKQVHAGLMVDAKVFSFTVDSYNKGNGPATIEIMTDANSDHTIFEQGNSYVVYLYQPLDKTYWENTYRVHGAQGVWLVTENDDGQNVASQELLPGGQTLPLQTLLDSQTGSEQSANFRRGWEDKVAAWQE